MNTKCVQCADGLYYLALVAGTGRAAGFNSGHIIDINMIIDLN